MIKIISSESPELSDSSIISLNSSNIQQENIKNNSNIISNISPYGAKSMLNNNKNNNGLNFNEFPNELIIKNILFYLDINTLPKFSLINKKCLYCIKVHIFIRIHFLSREKQFIEEQHKSQYDLINQKRLQFFSEYEMTPPTKEHAFSLMNLITTDDILELKQCFRKYNKIYEKVIIPFLILLGEGPVERIKPDGTKKISYYETAKNLLFKPDFIKRIRNLELETIPYNIFTLVEKKLKEDTFIPKNIKNLSPCFSKLILWVSGVIEFHRVIRKYSLSEYDYEILDQDEITFCMEMDSIILLYYKLLRYANKYCKDYEDIAKNIMNEMNII